MTSPDTTVTPPFVALGPKPSAFAKTSAATRTQPTASGESVTTGVAGGTVASGSVSWGVGDGVEGIVVLSGDAIADGRDSGEAEAAGAVCADGVVAANDEKSPGAGEALKELHEADRTARTTRVDRRITPL